MISLILEYLYLFIIEYLSSHLLWTTTGETNGQRKIYSINGRGDKITCRAGGQGTKNQLVLLKSHFKGGW